MHKRKNVLKRYFNKIVDYNYKSLLQSSVPNFVVPILYIINVQYIYLNNVHIYSMECI